MNTRLIMALCAASLLALTTAQAQTTSWKGTSSTSWSTAANWTAGVPTASLDAVIGDTNFTGTNQPNLSSTAVCRSLTVGTGTKSSTLTISRGLTVSGNITIGNNGKISHTSTSSSRVISLSGNWTNSGSYVGSSSSAAVTFSGTSQTIAGSTNTVFRRLNINASSLTTLACNIGVSNTLSVSGTFDPGAGSGFVVSGNSTMSVASGGKLLVRAATFGGNYTSTGTKTLSGGSTVDYAASGNQTVTNSLTYSTLRISGSGVKTLSGNLNSLLATNAACGNLDIAAGTLDLSTFTAKRGTNTVGGTVSVAAGAALKIGGTNTFPGSYLTHSLSSASTVEYGGTNQTVSAETYGHLTLSGSSGVVTKTMPASALTIAGNLTVNQGAATSVAFTAANAVTVGGDISLGTVTTFNGSTFSHSVGGNWTNNGTFTSSSGTITMNGVNGVMTGTGTNNFFNLTLARSGITASTNTSLNVAGDFVTSGAGTFTHGTGGSGTVAMSGASKSISGSGISFNKLTISGSSSSASSFTVADNLTVNGSLTSSSGTLTLSGAGKTMSGSGSIALSGLNVPGSITTTNNFSLSGNLSIGVAGSFTATAGTTTFAGSTVFNGTASLFHAVLNGSLLRMGADSVLRLAGTTTMTAGNFDVTNQRPNTVVYNSASSQTVYPITYDNLEIAAGGTKSSTGNLNVRGDFTIDAGAVFSGGTGGYTNYVRHNWLNYGTFNAGNSVVEMVGPGDSIIAGATTFDQLRVNKDTSSLRVNFLTNNVTAATLDMASGTMDTGTNTLIITTTRTGGGHVFGTITRQHSFTPGVSYAFEGPFTTVNFSALTSVSSVTMSAADGSISDFPSGAAVNRQYTVSLVSTGTYSATLRTYYQDTELNGNNESGLTLWRNGGAAWALSGDTASDTTDNWVEDSSLTNITGRWTMAADSGVVRWNGLTSTAWETPGNWTIVSGSPSLPPSTNDIVELGTTNVTYQPTITTAATARTISFGSAQAMTLTLAPGALLDTVGIQTIGNLGGVWTNAVTHNIDVGAQTLTVGGDLTLSDGSAGHAINLSLGSGTVNVANNLVQSGGANITFTGAGTLNISGGFQYTSGTFTPGTGTVNYTGSGAQNVGSVSYNQLVFNKPSGVATLPAAANVNGGLTLTNASRLKLNAPLTVAGSVLIYTNATLDLGGSEILVGGDWVCDGTLNISSGGEVAFNGTGAQSISGGTFHDFDIEKPSGTATLTGNITVVMDADVYSGTLDLAGYGMDDTASGASFSIMAGAKLRTAGNFPTGFATTTIDPAATVEYYGSGSQPIAAETYGHLILTNGTSSPKTLIGPIIVAGNLLIANNATLAASSNLLTLQGSWTNSGAFTAGTGTVVLDGTNQVIAGSTTFNNLTVPGSYTVANCNINISGNVTIIGSYAAGSGTNTIDGDLFNSGAMSSTGTTTFTGTRLQTIQLLTAISSVSSGVVNFNGTVSPVLNSTAPPLFANVNINNTGGVTASVGWTVYGSFKIGSGASFDGSGFAHTFYGTVTNNGTMTGGGAFNFSPANDTTMVLGNGFSSSGSVVFSGPKHITISSGALSLGSVEIANTHAAGITPVSNWTLAGDLRIDAGAVFHAGSSRTHSIAGNLDNGGTLDGGSSLVVFDGTSEIDGTGSTVFNCVLVSGSLTSLSAISLTGSFTNNGAFDASGVNVTFTGSSAATIAGSTTPTTIDTLVIAKSSASVSLAVNINEVSSLIISSGTLDTGAFGVSQNSVDGGALNVGASGTLKLGGSNPFPTFATVSLDSASTVNYGGTAQTVAPITYANLIFSGSGNKTLSSTATINGNLEIGGSALGNLTYASGSFTPVGSLTLGGALQVAGTWGSTSSIADHKSNTYFQGTGKLNVGNRALDHFAVTTPATQTAGNSFTIATITAQDANDNTVASFTGTVDLTETGDGAGGTVSPSQSGAFTAGVLTGQSVTLTKAGAAVTITVSDHAGTLKSGVSEPFTVNAGTMDHYAVTFSTPPFNAGLPFTTYVTAKDVYGNSIASDSSTWVTNSSSSLNMKWDATGIGEFENGLTSGEEYHIAQQLTNGVASFSTKDDVAELGVTITAVDANGKTGTSDAIDIDSAAGAYRSKTSGNWSSASTWESYDGSAWVNASSTPSAANGVITIRSGHTVTVSADVTADQVNVLSGGQVNVNSGVTFTIGSATSPGLEVYGTLHNGGTLTFVGGHSFIWTGGVLENSGTINSTFDTLEFEPGTPGGKYRHLFTTTAGTIPTAEWEVGSTCEIAGYTSNTSLPGGLDQSFYHFTWNCPSQTGTVVLSTNPTEVRADFMVASTGDGALTLGGNLAIGGTTTVNSDARLNCGTFALTGPAFTLASGGTLGIGSPDGIASSGASGNIQTTTRSFSTDGNYIYNGTAAQTPGNGLPASVNSLTIANSAGVIFSGTISVYSGCTVNGSSLLKAGGTISGPMIVNGTLAPGNSVGTLNTGAEDWNSGGSYEVEINDATGAAGTAPGWDWLNVTGPLTVNATSGSPFTLKVVSLNGSAAGSAANFDNAQNYSWRVATASAGVTDFAANKFEIDASGFQNSTGAVGTFSVTQSGNDVHLNFTPVFANAASYGRAWGTFQRLSVSTLLTNSTTGNTTREIVSVATGSQGTVPTVSGGLILLAPTHNLSESFQYVVQLNGHATSLATNLITVSVTNAVSTVNSISSSGGSGVTLHFAGVPGYSYAVERSTNLVNWTTVQTTNAPGGGVWIFIDATPPSPSFYRTRQNN